MTRKNKKKDNTKKIVNDNEAINEVVNANEKKIIVRKVVKRRKRKPKKVKVVVKEVVNEVVAVVSKDVGKPVENVVAENIVIENSVAVADNSVADADNSNADAKNSDAVADAENVVVENVVEPLPKPKNKPKRKKINKMEKLSELRRELMEGFNKKTAEIAEIKGRINKISNDFRNLNKKMNRYFREMGKINFNNPELNNDQNRNNKRKKRSKLSGIAGPTLISDKLCGFMELEHGSQVSRTTVNKKLNQYIKERNLQNTERNSVIDVDATLKHLLNVSDEDEVTYFNMQGYIKHNYLTS